MACYLIPTIVFLVHGFWRKKNPKASRDPSHDSLSLLFAGGTVFGMVDHIWNGEWLPVAGPQLAGDLALGVLITVTLLGVWGVWQWNQTRQTTRALQKTL